MNCVEFKKHVNELAEGILDEKKRSQMEEHMDVCAACRREYEDAKAILDAIRIDAASIRMDDKQKKDIKESILGAPVRKKRGIQSALKTLMYVAAIFMFITAGIYFSGGVNINIGPGTDGKEEESMSTELSDKVNELNRDKAQLIAEIRELKEEGEKLKSLIKDLESGKAQNWMMINPNLNEAIIEGRVLYVNKSSRSITLEVYMDDNTPDIDPEVLIPDGIMITRVDEEPLENGKYATAPGSIEDLKAGDHIAIHYLGNEKSARAILLFK